MLVERNSHFFPSNRKSRTVFIKVFFRNVPWSVSSYFLFVNSLLASSFYFQSFSFLCFAVTFHFAFSFDLFFLLFFIKSLKNCKILSGSSRPPYCSNSENTVKSTPFGLLVWKKWCLEKRVAKEIENYEPSQLNTLLERFYAEIS